MEICWTLQEKSLHKPLDYQAPHVDYTLGINWIKLLNN